MSKLNIGSKPRTQFGAIKAAKALAAEAANAANTVRYNKWGVVANLLSVVAGPAAPAVANIVGGFGNAITGRNNILRSHENFINGAAQANNSRIVCYVAMAVGFCVLPEVFALSAGCLDLSFDLTEPYANNTFTLVNNDTIQNSLIGPNCNLNGAHVNNSTLAGVFAYGPVSFTDSTIVSSKPHFGASFFSYNTGDHHGIEVNQTTYVGGKDDELLIDGHNVTVARCSFDTHGPSETTIIADDYRLRDKNDVHNTSTLNHDAVPTANPLAQHTSGIPKTSIWPITNPVEPHPTPSYPCSSRFIPS